MTDPTDPSNKRPARGGSRSPWRRFLWRQAQASRHHRADSQDLADQLASPRPALWQSRQRQQPLTPLVSSSPCDERTDADAVVPRHASKER